ncbi:MAG: tape measure protein [Clostridiales bacterium]|nr:tape measure protein [Clostridiales bacterium]
MAYDGTLKFDTSMDASGFQKGADGLGGIVKGLGVFKILEKGFQAVAASIGSAVQRYDALNKFPKVLEQMGFSANQAQSATNKLSDGIQGLPTTLDAVISTAQRLTVLTGNLEKSTDTTLALNNAFLASGASAGDAERGLEQYISMLSSGTVTIQRWRTLQETMGYSLQKVAEAFGYAGDSAQNDLYAALQSGKITIDQFNSKIIELNNAVGGFAELAKTSTGGIGTAWANMNTAIVRGTASIITSIDAGLSTTKFQSIENAINKMRDGINDALKIVADGFGVVAKNADWLVPSLAAVGVVVGAWKIGSILSTISTGFKAASTVAASYGSIMRMVAAADGDAAKIKTLMAVAMRNETTAEIIRTQAKAAGMTVDKAGNLITKEGVAATAAETATVLTNTGALTAKQVIVGVLTGQISFATAAQWAWNAAMVANPIGIILVAVVALIAVIALLVIKLNEQTEEEKKLAEETEKLAKAHDELISSIEASKAAYDSNVKSIEANAGAAQVFVDKIRALITIENRDEKQKIALSEAVKGLNKLVENSGIAYNALTDTLTGNISAVDDRIAAIKREARAEAARERMIELAREQIQLDIQRAEEAENSAKRIAAAEEKLAEARAANEQNSQTGWALLAHAENKLLKVQNEIKKSTKELDDAYADLGNQMDFLTGYVIDETIAQKELGDEVEKTSAKYEAAAEKQTLLAEAKAAAEKKYAEEMLIAASIVNMTMDEFENAVKRNQKTVDEYYAAATNAFSKLGKDVKYNMKGVIENINDGAKRTVEFGSRIQELEGKVPENFINKLKDMGIYSADARGMLAMLANATPTELAKFNEALADSETAIDGLFAMFSDPANANLGSDMMNEIAAGITGNPAIDTALIEAVKTAKERALPEALSVSADLGAAVDEGTAFGIENNAHLISEAYEKILGICNDAGKKGAQKNAEGYSAGIPAAAKQVKADSTTIGNNAADGLGSALDKRKPELLAKAKSIASGIAGAMRNALQISSPSRVLMRIFEWAMMGPYVAMQDMSGKLYRKAEDIAEGIAEHLSITPDIASNLTAKLRAVVEIDPFGARAHAPVAAMAGAGGVTYVTNLYQTNNSPVPLSPAELTREGQDMLDRSHWQLP